MDPSAVMNDLVERFHARLVGYARHLVGNAADAEDLVDDVWYEMWRRLQAQTIDPPRAPGLLFRMVSLRSIDHLRHRGRTEALEAQAAGPGEEPEPIALVLRDEDSARVRAAVARLPVVERAAVHLRYFEEMGLQQIADALGLSGASQAQRVVLRALLRLRDLLADGPVPPTDPCRESPCSRT